MDCKAYRNYLKPVCVLLSLVVFLLYCWATFGPSQRESPVTLDWRSSGCQQASRPLVCCANDTLDLPRFAFQIALGKDYYSRIAWGKVKQNLMSRLPLGFEFQLYTDTACAEFLMRYFPEHVRLFDRLPHPAWKADLIRYLLLYKYGGVYIDVDLQLVAPLEEIIHRAQSNHVFVIAAKQDPPFEAANGFIITPAGDSLFLVLVDGLREDAGATDYGVNVKRFYKELSLRYPGLADYANVRDAYFMREEQVKSTSSGSAQYVINMDRNVTALLSNGFGYPPKER